MRTVTFASRSVRQHLGADFVCAWQNIEGEAVCGGSNAHVMADRVPVCPRGGGEHNTQLVCLSADARVMHVMAGFKDAESMCYALDFVLRLKMFWTGDAGNRERLLPGLRAAFKKAPAAAFGNDNAFMTLHAGEFLADFSFARLLEGRGFEGGFFAGSEKMLPTEGLGRLPPGAERYYAAGRRQILEARLRSAEDEYDANSTECAAQLEIIVSLLRQLRPDSESQ